MPTFTTIYGNTVELEHTALFAPMEDGVNNASTRICLSQVSDLDDVIVLGSRTEINAAFGVLTAPVVDDSTVVEEAPSNGEGLPEVTPPVVEPTEPVVAPEIETPVPEVPEVVEPEAVAEPEAVEEKADEPEAEPVVEAQADTDDAAETAADGDAAPQDAEAPVAKKKPAAKKA